MTTPAGAIRPILFPVFSVNQRLPSDPAAIPEGPLSAVGIGNSVRTPAGVSRPIFPACCSVNQRFPSAPAMMPDGSVGVIGNSVTTWPRATLARPAPRSVRSNTAERLSAGRVGSSVVFMINSLSSLPKGDNGGEPLIGRFRLKARVVSSAALSSTRISPPWIASGTTLRPFIESADVL